MIHSLQPYTPNSVTSFQAGDAASTSANCFESETEAERAACASPRLAPLNRDVALALAGALREADPFARDALMAYQRAWLLNLPDECHLPAPNGATVPQDAETCLAAQFSAQAAALRAWNGPSGRIGAGAMAQYVHWRISPGAQSMNPALCQNLARQADGAVARSGAVTPADFASEIAGSHGPAAAVSGGRRYAVDLVQANAYGGFQMRARSVSVDGATVLDSSSLGALQQSVAVNSGARFSAFASQTGDYGAADIFAEDGRVIALLEEPWGFYTPASPGEYAHAGAWNLSAGTASPLCLFDTYRMPAGNDAFDALPAFGPFRQALSQIRDSGPPLLGVSTLRDQAQIRLATEWSVLNMPLVTSAQARDGGWTLWLRRRHDDVLDALFAWGMKDPAHKPIFDHVFGLLRPAAQDLVTAFQQQQALSGAEAKEAAGIAIMELMYGATAGIAPRLGADLSGPGDAAAYRPRYPILASPS